MSDFYACFKENMDALGLPAPESLFGTAPIAVANAATILCQIDKCGLRATLREIIGAGARLDGLAAAGGCIAAYYAGAVVGSLAVANGRSLARGTSLADVVFTAKKNGLDRKWLVATWQRWPGLHDSTLVASRAGMRARSAA